MKVVSLFSGAGGLDMGLTDAGHDIIAQCEIDRLARSVLRYHNPTTPIHDDVTTWKASDAHLGRVDLVAGGSPCQDLSVAGRRGGLDGERSGLFWHQCRIADELAAPWFLWENVAGAFSSNGGADFAAVLWGITGTLPVVPDGGWKSCGVVVGPKRTAVWRLLDAQWFGVAQRRRRVFVVGGPRGLCGPEVLALAESVSGHPRPSRTPGQGVAGTLGGGAGSRGWSPDTDRMTFVPTTSFNWQGSAEQGADVQTEYTGSLGCTRHPADAFSENQRGEVITHDVAHSVKVGGGKPGQGYPAVMEGDEGAINQDSARAWMCILRHRLGAQAFHEWASRGLRGVQPEEVLRPALHGCRLRDAPQDGQPVMDDGALPRTEDLPARSLSALRELWSYGRSPHGRELAEQLARELGTTVPELPHQVASVRRITPREAERLMGWPDDHTRWGHDGTEIADSHRYRMCGNGVVAPVAEWIGQKLLEAVR